MLHVYILSTAYYYLCRFYSIFHYKEAHGIKFFTHHIFQRLLHKRRKREEKKGLQAPSVSESFARYAENFGCGNRTVLGTIQGDVYDDNDHNSIGTPAMIEVSSVPSTESYDFGGGYTAPQETVDVKVLYNA